MKVFYSYRNSNLSKSRHVEKPAMQALSPSLSLLSLPCFLSLSLSLCQYINNSINTHFHPRMLISSGYGPRVPKVIILQFSSQTEKFLFFFVKNFFSVQDFLENFVLVFRASFNVETPPLFSKLRTHNKNNNLFSFSTQSQFFFLTSS